MASNSKRRIRILDIFKIILAVIIVLGVFYLTHPAITLRSTDSIGYVFFSCILIKFLVVPIFTNWDAISEKRVTKENAFYYIVGSLIILCISYFIIGLISSAKLFNVDNYRSIPTIETEASFEDDFPEVDPNGNNIPYVDLETARHLGDRSIGKLNHASWYDVDDDYNLVCYKGTYYRLSPLNYRGIFEWFSAQKEGIPGYVLVNAKTMSVDFVEVDGGYYYSPTALFSKNLYRHLRWQYPTSIFGDSNFEIDEEGHPYWVTAIYDVTAGLFGGYKANNLAVTDAVTGETELYSIDDIPNWIDHGIRLNYIMDVMDKYYELVHGCFNFSREDIFDTSFESRTSGSKDDDTYDEPFAGYTSFIDTNGDVCFYTGLTPANKAESNAGFLLINCRTGAVKQYLFASDDGGNSEKSAVARAESEVQNYGYQATFPMMLNVAGQPTYLMCLKGKDGLIKRVSLVLVSTKASTIIIGENLEDTVAKFEASLVDSKILDSKEVDVEVPQSNTVMGTISQIYEINVEGTTHLLYEIEGYEDLFDSSITLGYTQIRHQIGEIVTITYLDSVTDRGVYTVSEISE